MKKVSICIKNGQKWGKFEKLKYKSVRKIRNSDYIKFKVKKRKLYKKGQKLRNETSWKIPWFLIRPDCVYWFQYL